MENETLKSLDIPKAVGNLSNIQERSVAQGCLIVLQAVLKEWLLREPPEGGVGKGFAAVIEKSLEIADSFDYRLVEGENTVTVTLSRDENLYVRRTARVSQIEINHFRAKVMELMEYIEQPTRVSLAEELPSSAYDNVTFGRTLEFVSDDKNTSWKFCDTRFVGVDSAEAPAKKSQTLSGRAIEAQNLIRDGMNQVRLHLFDTLGDRKTHYMTKRSRIEDYVKWIVHGVAEFYRSQDDEPKTRTLIEKRMSLGLIIVETVRVDNKVRFEVMMDFGWGDLVRVAFVHPLTDHLSLINVNCRIVDGTMKVSNGHGENKQHIFNYSFSL